MKSTKHELEIELVNLLKRGYHLEKRGGAVHLAASYGPLKKEAKDFCSKVKNYFLKESKSSSSWWTLIVEKHLNKLFK